MAHQIADQNLELTPALQSAALTPSLTSVGPLDSYTVLYNQLNPEQKLAVDTIEGPVMVVAGPGTGKTQILTLRIATILRQTQMNPRNILALTFTDSAAQNMRKRLLSIIGSAAYGVGIYTFHGFANMIISEFPYKFQFAKDLEQLDEIERLEIMEKLFDKLALTELRPARAPYHYVSEAISRISDLKREYVTPDQLRLIAETEKNRLNEDPASFHEKGAYKGKMRAAVTEELKQLERCLELARLYDAYQQELQDHGLYDYDDMIVFVVQALENDPDLKAYYQERFQYVLVDEYQDTNNSQNRLIELVTDFFTSPNLFVVGDDKQSIFRFQGASMANLLRFHQRYPDMKVIGLKQNYRSHQPILDGSYRVISNSLERITKHLPGVDDQLSAHRSAQAEHPPLNRGVFSTPDLEAYWIASKIQSLLKEGVAAEEIAIIYKENREAEPFADILGRLNITYSLERGSNVLADNDIRRLITILRAVASPTDSRSVFEYLHYDFTGVNGVDILKLMAYRSKTHQSILDVLEKLPCGCPVHQYVGTDEQPVMEFLDCQKLTDSYQQLGEWRIKSANLSMPELVEAILTQSGLLKQITENPTRIERLHRLRRFFDEIKRLSNKITGLSLDQLLEHIDLLISNNIQLVPEPLDSSDKAGAIRLMTAHKAKGLEFSHVFLPNLVDKHWGNASRRTLIKLPAQILGTASQSNQEKNEEKNEDDRRLFYVALTRAKECAYLTYSRTKNGKELLPSQFLTELGDQDVTDIDTTATEQEAGAHLLVLFAPIVESTFTDQEAAYLRQLISEQPITPTGLNNYLRCPKGYLYKNLLRVPTAKTAQQGYGTAIHAAMQSFFLQHRASKHVPTVDDLLAAFEASLKKEILSEVEYADFWRIGKQVLTAYYEKHLRAVVPTVAVEYNFQSHHVVLPSPKGDIYLTGILDKLELIDGPTNAVRVIDYKTGRARSRNEIEGKTARQDEDYKRQLIFYQLLGNLDKQFPFKIVETGLAFVDDDGRFPIEKFTISKEEVNDLKELIKQVYIQMLNLEFPHIEDPNRPPCEFCSL